METTLNPKQGLVFGPLLPFAESALETLLGV